MVPKATVSRVQGPGMVAGVVTGSEVGAATEVRARASYVKLGSASAAANSAALVKRSAGSFSSDLASAWPTWGGTVLRSLVIDGASIVRILTSTAWAVDAEKGGCPESISYRTHPSAYTSDLGSTSRSPVACSGLM